MKPRSPRGFTLVEMMAVVAIAAVLLAVAVPSFIAATARARLEGAANELSVDLQYARSEAIRRRTSATLSVNADGGGYTLTYFDPTSASNVNFKTVTMPATVTVTGSATVQFTSLRGLAAAQTIDISSTKTSAALRVATNATGRVQLCTPSSGFGGYPAC